MSQVGVAFRRTFRSGLAGWLNIFGLAAGLSAMLFLILLVTFERGYDRWLPEADSIYRLEFSIHSPGVPARDTALSVPATGQAFAERLPAIKAFTRLSQGKNTSFLLDDDPVERRLFHADPNFFTLFPLTFIAGDRNNALSAPNGIVLSETAAKDLVGDTAALGKILHLENGREYRITGVFQDIREDSHLNMALIASTIGIQDYAALFEKGRAQLSLYTYVHIEKNADIPALEKSLNEIFVDLIGFQAVNDVSPFRISLVAVPDIHLKSSGIGQMKPVGDARLIRSLEIVMLLIFAVVALNLSMLSIAGISTRHKEIGIRRILGASSPGIARMLIAESFANASVALLLAAGIMPVLMAHADKIVGDPIALSRLFGGRFLMAIPVVLLLLVLMSGGYPALRLSKMPAAFLLAGANANFGKGRLRALMVTTQFAFASFLLISSLYVLAQTRHASSYAQGISLTDRYNTKSPRDATYERLNTLRTEAEKLPAIHAASLMSPAPPLTASQLSAIPVSLPGGDGAFVQMSRIMADHHLASTFGIIPLAGAWYDGASSDVAVLDQSALRALGLGDPPDAIGATISVKNEKGENRSLEIIGVVEDLAWGSARERFGPLIYVPLSSATGATLVARFNPSRRQEAEAALRSVWRESFPHTPFSMLSLEDAYGSLARHDRARLFSFMASGGLAILLSAAGLYGITAFFLARQKREIALRKLFGATIGIIGLLLLRRYSAPVMIGFLISAPIAYIYNSRWLAQFASRISPGVELYALAGAALATIALAAISGLVFKAAHQKPGPVLSAE